MYASQVLSDLQQIEYSTLSAAVILDVTYYCSFLVSKLRAYEAHAGSNALAYNLLRIP